MQLSLAKISTNCSNRRKMFHKHNGQRRGKFFPPPRATHTVVKNLTCLLRLRLLLHFRVSGTRKVTMCVHKFDHWLEMTARSNNETLQQAFPGQIVEYAADCRRSCTHAARKKQNNNGMGGLHQLAVATGKPGKGASTTVLVLISCAVCLQLLVCVVYKARTVVVFLPGRFCV